MITMKDIVLEGHPALRKRAEKLTFPLTEEQQELAKEMLEFLHNSQNPEIAEKYELRAGVGLAAVKYQDVNGDEFVRTLTDYEAIVVQHEIDHLNGVMFYDHINKTQPMYIPKGAVVIGE